MCNRCDVNSVHVTWFHLPRRRWNQDGVFQLGERLLDVEQHAWLEHTGRPETWNQHFTMWDHIMEVIMETYYELYLIYVTLWNPISCYTWWFPCPSQMWVWRPEGCTSSYGCKFSLWRLRSWVFFPWRSLRLASSHTAQLQAERHCNALTGSQNSLSTTVGNNVRASYSLASCPERCSVAIDSTGSDFCAVCWLRILQSLCRCTPGSFWCCAWRSPYSPHSWRHRSDALMKKSFKVEGCLLIHIASEQ